MFEIYQLSVDKVVLFGLVLIRVSTLFVTWPVLGSDSVPPFVKALLSLATTLVVAPVVIAIHPVDVSLLRSEALVWLVLREMLLGVALGFLARGFFFALSVCGELVSLSIGLSTDQMLNPSLGGRAGALDQLYIILGSLLYLGLSGHHFLIEALVKSFELVPLTKLGLNVAVFQDMGVLMTDIMSMGIRLAAPIVATVFLMNVGLGLISRLVPQVNILVTSASVNVLTGLVILTISLPLLVHGFNDLIFEMSGVVMQYLKSF